MIGNMKKLILLTLLSSAYAKIEYPADSLLKSKSTTLLQKIFIYPVAQWQKISYKSSTLNCQFYPSCSNYCSLAIKDNGPLFGSIIAMDRITRCNPSALSYHQKINGAYKDEDGRLIDYVNPASYNQNLKSSLLSSMLAFIPGIGRFHSGRFYDGIYGMLNLLLSAKAYSLAIKTKNKPMANIFGGTSAILYASEVYGSLRASKYYQPKKPDEKTGR
jgi:putative component of membrane protein insertase Oxa1/YidC/SpoIIIJ protein YidD